MWLNQAAPSWWMVVTMSWVQDALPSSLTWHKIFSCSGILASYFIYWNLSLGETATYPLVPFPPASIVVDHWAGPVASQNKYYISQIFLSRCDPGIKFWPMGQVVSGSSIWKSSLSFFGFCLFHSMEIRWLQLEKLSPDLKWHWDWRCGAKHKREGPWIPDTLHRRPSIGMPTPWFLV